jgi:hypothetical protein
MAMRLSKAEAALEHERLTCAQLRRQLESLQHHHGHHLSAPPARDSPGLLSPSGRPQAAHSSPSAGGGGSALATERSAGSGMLSPMPSASGGPSYGRASLSFPMFTDEESLQQELKVAQTQLLQRTVEAERLRRQVSEQEGLVAKLRAQVEGLSHGGRLTLSEEQELEKRVGELDKVSFRIRAERGAAG